MLPYSLQVKWSKCLSKNVSSIPLSMFVPFFLCFFGADFWDNVQMVVHVYAEGNWAMNTFIWCYFDHASSLICGNKMPTRCNRGFYCRSYCLLNMFQASPCPLSGAQEYYTVVAACGILCCGFSSSWSGVELRVMRPVCRMLGMVMPEKCWASNKICNKNLCCI